MKIREELKVREMAGEQVVIMPGRVGSDMTKVLSLNGSSLYLWNALRDREFTAEEVADLLIKHYEVDAQTAMRDAEAWVTRLRECSVLI